MRGKVARRERALRRSQENTRLTRKAGSVERSEQEREFDRQMAEARTERADAMKAANATAEKKHKTIEDERKKAVQAADTDYIEKRNAIVKKLSARAKSTV